MECSLHIRENSAHYLALTNLPSDSLLPLPGPSRSLASVSYFIKYLSINPSFWVILFQPKLTIDFQIFPFSLYLKMGPISYGLGNRIERNKRWFLGSLFGWWWSFPEFKLASKSFVLDILRLKWQLDIHWVFEEAVKQRNLRLREKSWLQSWKSSAHKAVFNPCDWSRLEKVWPSKTVLRIEYWA